MNDEDFKRAEFLLYEEKVRKLSNKTFRKEYFEQKGYRGKGLELDHKLSIKDGFDQDVPIETMAHPLNLRLITAKANKQKGSKSTVTFSELIEEISTRDSLFD